MHIEFFGAAREVTGFCHLLRVAGHQILVDCGLIQGSAADERRNAEPFPFDPRQINAVVLTHAHLDHSGRLPILTKAGFRGPIYAHPATRDLCRIMLRDAAYINEKEAEWSNKKRVRKGLPAVDPLYTSADAAAAVKRIRPIEYGVDQEIVAGVRIRLNDAGHILGSSIVEAWLEEQSNRRKLVFTGDLGQYDAPILRDPQPVAEADLVIMESTYGDRLHRPWANTWQEIAAIAAETAGAAGNVLIPSFAVGRTQELLYLFKRHFDEWGLGRWSIFLDSPLAIEATEIYAKHYDLYDPQAAAVHRSSGSPFDLPNLQFSRTAKQSMALNRIRSGAIIIAGSGMCTGGRIKHHLKHNIWRSNCHVIIVGFQARGTPGRALVDGARYIRLWGETIRVAAKIHTVGGLSAHADQAALLRWYDHMPSRPRVALVHGEMKAMENLGRALPKRGAQDVDTPALGESLDLAAWQTGRAMPTRPS